MDPDLTIVLLGNSGVGKSASGNTILGRPAFESRKAFRSVTKQISEVTETVFEKQISVVDTPGILGSEGEVQTRCQDLLQSSRPCVFLVVVKIDRFTIEQKNAVEKAIRAVGDQDFNKCYLLFTGGDDLDNMSVDEFINEDPEGPLPPLVERFAGRHHVFNNENGGPEQVRELLMKSGHLRINPEEVDEMRIVLLGLPGHGKSASGNTILGFERFESAASFNAVTTESVCKSEIINKCKIKVVDTPGFTGTKLSPRKLFEEIMKSVEMASPGPHCFIIVVKIDRISDTDVKLLKMLPKLFSREAPKHAMVLITHGDALGQRQSIGDLIDSNDQMSQLVSMCGGRYCVFDNAKKVNRVQKGNKVQVENLLDNIHDMVRANGGQHYTSEMFHNSQDIRVKIDIKWHELGQWFIRMIRELDACRRHNGYTLVREMEETLKHIRHQHQCS